MKNLIVLFLIICSSLAMAGDIKPIEVGTKAPNFTLKNYDGKEYSLSGMFRDHKFAVVMFIATKCPVSNAYNERMVKLYDGYAKQGIAFLGINANVKEDVKEIAEHSKSKGFQFPVLKDVENKIADLYGATVTPEIYIIDGHDKVVYHGRIDDSKNPDKIKLHDLADALELLLAGKPLVAAEHSAFGCSIKRVVAD